MGRWVGGLVGRWFFFVVSLNIVQLHLVFFTPIPRRAPSCVLHLFAARRKSAYKGTLLIILLSLEREREYDSRYVLEQSQNSFCVCVAQTQICVCVCEGTLLRSKNSSHRPTQWYA